MEAHDYNGEHQPDLKLLVKRYEDMLLEGGITFLEADSFLMLSDYYEDESNFNLALDVIRHAIQQHPFSTSLFIRKAQLLSEQEKYDLAFNALDMAVLYSPSELDIYLTKADIYLRMLQHEKALQVLSIAKEYAGVIDLADIHILESTIYETKKNYSKAIECLKYALSKDASNDIALSRLWGLYDLAQEYGNAIAFHKDFINENPYSYWAWFNLGHAYLNLEMIENAAEAFDYVIVINDRFEPAYHYYSDCLIGLGKYDLALRYLNEYQDFFKADAQVWYYMGQCYEFKSEYKKAIYFYTKALDTNNFGGRIYHCIGNCYIMQNLWDLAEKSFLQAYKIDKFNEEFCLSLADTYDALGDSEKAHDFYHKALAIAPKEISIWIHYIEFLMDEECYSVAIEMLAEAKEYIDDIILDYALAAVLLESGQRQEGFIVLGRALNDNYKAHKHFFQISPKLKEDASVASLIMHYHEE